jgi:phosphate transport system protein
MSSKHTVRSYDEELALLKASVLEMGKLSHRQLSRALETVLSRDSSAAEAIMADDTPINALQEAIDQLTLIMLAKRQPMAVDLRFIVSGLRMASDLERIADYAASMARHSMELNSVDLEKPVEAIIRMAEGAKAMLSDVMMAYERKDSELARKVWHEDEGIDAEYSKLLSDLRGYMTEDSEHAKPFTALLFVARCCERIGDHIQNLAENVHFIVTGRMYHGN